MAEYIDNDRRLPMETGVIDLGGFLKRLAALAYDGPVTPEPFSATGACSREDPQPKLSRANRMLAPA